MTYTEKCRIELEERIRKNPKYYLPLGPGRKYFVLRGRSHYIRRLSFTQKYAYGIWSVDDCMLVGYYAPSENRVGFFE